MGKQNWRGLTDCCESCRQTFIELLNERIEDTLAMAKNEADRDHACAHCFEFCELRRIVEGGTPALGRYADEIVATVEGPLFRSGA